MLYSCSRLGSLPQDLRPFSFRTAALSFTTAAALFAMPAMAQQVAANGTATTGTSSACDRYAADQSNKGFKAEIGCLIKESDKRIQDNNRRAVEADKRGNEADKRAAEADKQNQLTLALQACMDFLKRGTADKKFTHEQVLDTVGGKLNRENVCDAARKHGYERRAATELSPKL